METKINYNRVIIGGLAAGIVIILVGFAVHGLVLHDHYMYFSEMGSVLKEPRMMWLHMVIALFSGIPLALLYVIGRKFGGPGPMTAIKIGFLVSLLNLDGASAMYCFYNTGGMIPLMTFVSAFIGYILGALTAGALYKD